ncbi:MAG: carboxypeptidase regulatory-like domain-containing protein [Sinomonas sp.]|nr:carboxypeptidase regulatory-like domain-containing protein [Sinomonas sp.]
MRAGTALAAALATAALFLGSCGSESGSAATSSGTPGSGGATATAGTATATIAGTASAGTGTIGPGTSSPAPSSSATATPSPTASTTSAPPLMPPSGVGLYGYVTAGPTCPVERPGHPCPPRPVSASIEARKPDGVTVASTFSDSYGRYALDISPGSYLLVVVTPSPFPRCPETPVTVRPGSAARADVSCDTGIR